MVSYHLYCARHRIARKWWTIRECIISYTCYAFRKYKFRYLAESIKCTARYSCSSCNCYLLQAVRDWITISARRCAICFFWYTAVKQSLYKTTVTVCLVYTFKTCACIRYCQFFKCCTSVEKIARHTCSVFDDCCF